MTRLEAKRGVPFLASVCFIAAEPLLTRLKTSEQFCGGDTPERWVLLVHAVTFKILKNLEHQFL